MSFFRSESWGRVIYDPERDEFLAEIASTSQRVQIGRPLSAGCLITRACNLRCGFCYGNLEALPDGSLSRYKWSELFSHMHNDWGLMRVDLSGGEPTLRSDCAEIAKAAIDAGLSVVLSTNGTLLDKRGLAGFPSNLRVHVSFDSGFEAIHEKSRRLPTLTPSVESFSKTSRFTTRCLDDGFRVRALTCVGVHNCDGLFALAEHLAKLEVPEWNISHVLPAGRAQVRFEDWSVSQQRVSEQVDIIRSAFSWMIVRYSHRVEQDGYFLLVLNDGSLATQYTDFRDKLVIGSASMPLSELQAHPNFCLTKHASKWIAAEVAPQLEYSFN